jgi:hypothetical protein
MLVLIDEAYARAAVFSPYGNAHGGIVPGVRAVDPEPARGGATPDGRKWLAVALNALTLVCK